MIYRGTLGFGNELGLRNNMSKCRYMSIIRAPGSAQSKHFGHGCRIISKPSKWQMHANASKPHRIHLRPLPCLPCENKMPAPVSKCEPATWTNHAHMQTQLVLTYSHCRTPTSPQHSLHGWRKTMQTKNKNQFEGHHTIPASTMHIVHLWALWLGMSIPHV